jgi:hypothetical protein
LPDRGLRGPDIRGGGSPFRFVQQSVTEAREAVRVTQAKYGVGQIDFNRVFTVETLLVAQQDQFATAQGNLAVSLIELYRALGGGSEICLDPMIEEPTASVRSSPSVLPRSERVAWHGWTSKNRR